MERKAQNLDAGPDIRLDVDQGERGNEFRLTLRSPQHVAGLAELAALLAARLAPYASRMELETSAESSAELRFTADRRELTKWAMGGLRREVLLATAQDSTA